MYRRYGTWNPIKYGTCRENILLLNYIDGGNNETLLVSSSKQRDSVNRQRDDLHVKLNK